MQVFQWKFTSRMETKWREDHHISKLHTKHTQRVFVCLLNLQFLARKFVEQNGIFYKINGIQAIAVVSTTAAPALPSRQPAVAFQNYQNMHSTLCERSTLNTAAAAVVYMRLSQWTFPYEWNAKSKEQMQGVIKASAKRKRIARKHTQTHTLWMWHLRQYQNEFRSNR